MAEYIERETLLKEMQRLEELARDRVCDTPSRSPAYPRYCAQLSERTDMVKRINELPAADVVEVVRCKDCKHFREWSDGNLTCHIWTDTWDAATGPNDFCSYGERRDDHG